jgi:hypothetical protein
MNIFEELTERWRELSVLLLAVQSWFPTSRSCAGFSAFLEPKGNIGDTVLHKKAARDRAVFLCFACALLLSTQVAQVRLGLRDW